MFFAVLAAVTIYTIPMSKSRLKNILTPTTPVIIGLFAVPLAIMPTCVSSFLVKQLALFLFRFSGKSRQRVLDNITASLPALSEGSTASVPLQPDAIIRKAVGHYACSIVEVIKVYFGLGRRMLDDIQFRGVEHYLGAKEKGKGIIFLTGHCGNWELLALSFGLKYETAAIVVRPQVSESVSEILDRLRGKYGNRTIHRKGAAFKVLSTLRSGQVVAILADIAVKPAEGVLTPFLGRPAWTTPLPAAIAHKTGCALVPVFIHREGRGHVVEFHPPLDTSSGDVTSTTAAISRSIESHIINYPHEWLWLYRRWKGTEPKKIKNQAVVPGHEH